MRNAGRELGGVRLDSLLDFGVHAVVHRQEGGCDGSERRRSDMSPLRGSNSERSTARRLFPKCSRVFCRDTRQSTDFGHPAEYGGASPACELHNAPEPSSTMVTSRQEPRPRRRSAGANCWLESLTPRGSHFRNQAPQDP
jgi:hypothetical protein